jgi:signal transduction histidine kinase/ActR/RegA family two-component response regulator
MDATDTLLTRYVQDAVSQLGDHSRILKGIITQLAGSRSEFVARWKTILDQESGAHWTRPTNEMVEQATRVLVDDWNAQNDLSAYLLGIAAWSTDRKSGGVNYLDAARLIETFRRALLPVLISTYAAGPDLELAFRALDAYERAVLGVIALAQIEATQNQLTYGSHQRSVGRLMGGVMHSLNNTMAVIVGRAQILEEQVTDESQREELRAIQKIARTGADSLKRLQQFAAEGDGREGARLDVNLIINDVIQVTRFRWRDDAEASGIAIDVVKDLVPVPAIMGQPSALRDALVELILNSVEAMPLGGLVTLRTEQVEDEIQIVITDQGEGMDTATQTRAPEALFTTKGVGHIGLGLTTVANIARQMGGTLAIESTSGRGTTVTLAFPIAGEALSTSDLRPARLARWASILVVDDEPLVRDVAARTFHLRGFRTIAADSGADAVRAFSEQGPFQVVIVDLGMPGMNGFETARAIKQLNPRTIIILMTGWAAELDAKKMREAGIDRAIAKPFDVDQVIQLISEALAIQEKM